MSNTDVSNVTKNHHLATFVSVGVTCRELIALGRAYRGDQITLEQYRDRASITLRHWNGTLAPGRFAEQRSSGAARRRAA